MNPMVFDAWRENYETTTIDGHAAIYTQAYIANRGLSSCAVRAVKVFLNQLRGQPNVAEVGGSDGALASEILEAFPGIARWTNYEICDEALRSSATSDPRYKGKLMTDFRWWLTSPVEGDALIMSHVLEHLSDEDAKSFIGSLPPSIKAVHIQAPIAMRGPTDWKGANGAHILSMGWREIDDEFCRKGFHSVVAYDGASWRRA